MWSDIIGILNYLGPVQVFLLSAAVIFAIVFFIGDWRWGKHGYDPKWLEDKRKEMERENIKRFLK